MAGMLYLVVFCGGAVGMMQGCFFPDKPRFGTLAQLNENQRHRARVPVAQKTQPLGFQLVPGTCGDDLPKPLRTVDKKKVTAVFQ